MKKILFMFPGVGSQYVGMGRVFFDEYKVFRDTFEEAGDILSIDIRKLCLSPDSKEELDRLENAQCALVVIEVALFRLYMEEIGLEPTYCTGHSLGEYSALCCAGVVSFSDTLQIVRHRGKIITEAAASLKGTMAWVINLDSEIAERICEEARKKGGHLFVSAYDSPTQVSISGKTPILMKMAKKLEKAGAIVFPLQFSGPFHCPLMDRAANQMKEILGQYNFSPPLWPVIANCDVNIYKEEADVRQKLSQQLNHPLLWRDSVDFAISRGIDTAVEVGPKNVLTFLLQKNVPGIQRYIMDKLQDIERMRNDFFIQQDEYLSLIGRCLGAAVSTRNRNGSLESYQRDVIVPYREIEGIYNKWEGQDLEPDQEEVNKALTLLANLMSAKKVTPQERQAKMSQVFRGKTLRNYGRINH